MGTFGANSVGALLLALAPSALIKDACYSSSGGYLWRKFVGCVTPDFATLGVKKGGLLLLIGGYSPHRMRSNRRPLLMPRVAKLGVTHLPNLRPRYTPDEEYQAPFINAQGGKVRSDAPTAFAPKVPTR